MQIGESHLHRHPSSQQRVDAQFEEWVAGNQFAGPRLEVSRPNLANLQAERAQKASDLVLVVPQLVDLELARGQQCAQLLAGT